MNVATLWRGLNLLPRLVIAVTVVFVALYALFSVFALRAVDDSTDRILRERLVIAQMAARELDRTLERALHELQASRAFGRFDPKSPSLADEYHLLAHAHGGLGSVSLGVYFLDPRGRLVLAEPRTRARDVGVFQTKQYVRRVIATRRQTISVPFRDRTGRLTVALAAPVANADGSLRSILVGLLDLSAPDIVAPLRESTRLGRTGHGELVGPGGTVIASSDPHEALQHGEHLPFYRRMLAERTTAVENVLYTPMGEMPPGRSHEHHVMAWAPLRAAPWGVSVGGTETETFASVNRLRRTLLLAGAGALGGLWLVTLLGAHFLVRPVRKLTRAAEEMAAGDLERPIQIGEGGEIGVLGRSLDAMRAQLKESLQAIRRWGEQLETKVGERTEELRVRNRQLAAVTAVATAANRAHDLRGVLDACLPAILEHAQMDGVAVRLVDESTGGLGVPVAGAGSEDFACRQPAIRADECPCGVAASKGEALFLAGDELRTFEPPCKVEARALAVLPLRREAGLLGVLALARRTGESPTAEDRRVLAAIADQIAIAIENAQLAEELARIEAQREVERVRAQLVSAVSHELRTPLGLIKSYATTLLREGVPVDPETRQQFLEIIDEESGKLEQMIDELLDSARLQTGRLSIKPEPVDLAGLVQNAALKMRPAFEETGHELVLRLPEHGVRGMADPLRVEQVVNNLLENAARYSDRGTTVEVDVAAEDGYALVAVKDSGDGVPAEEQERIFEPFYRGANSRGRGGHGVGLGLAICRGLVEAQGGTIWVESAPGRGATFFVSLPVAA